jgi:molecular chaperone HscB
MNACWQCGSEQGESLFCKLCNALQRPTPDYYRFFGIPKKLAIDTGDLQRRFYEMSRILHPDRFLRRAPTEQQYSLEATSILNDGYRVLRDPVSRAEYILKEAGFDIGEQRSKNVPPELLEEVFELNMALEELRGGEEGVRPRLEEARRQFLSMRAEIDSEMERLFRKYDETGERAVLGEIRDLLNRRTYIRNLIVEVDKELGI